MPGIPESVRAMISDIIMKEEGGWHLSSNPNDNDGGWTYAGVTATTWYTYTKQPFSYSGMVKQLATDPQDVANHIFDIYFEEYYLVLAKNRTDQVLQEELSCAINVGVGTAVGLIQKVKDTKTDFLTVWHMYYFNLIKMNARAWKAYAEYLEWIAKGGPAVSDQEVVMKPKTLRAEFINGWFNRVERYRDKEIS